MNRHLLQFVSAIALAVMAMPVASAALLAVDVNDRETVRAGTEAGNTVTGFQQFILSGTPATGTAPAVGTTTQTLGAYTVSVTATNASNVTQGGIDDRDRAAPTTAPSLNQLYDDFIFTAAGVGVGGGIDLAISGGALQPNTPYKVAIYSFDASSVNQPQPRTANWLDGNNGDSVILTTSFSAAGAPTSDNQYRFTGTAVTDGAGALLLRGRSLTGIASEPGVFLNGFEIVPEPASLALAGFAGVALATVRRRAA